MMPARNTFADWDILLVDDSIESLNVLEIVLKHYGAVVHRATQGAEALDVITAVRPRLIICDLAMPVMDGWDLITRLKQDPSPPPRRQSNRPKPSLVGRFPAWTERPSSRRASPAPRPRFASCSTNRWT